MLSDAVTACMAHYLLFQAAHFHVLMVHRFPLLSYTPTSRTLVDAWKL